MSRLWRIATDAGFLIAQIAIFGVAGWQMFEWLSGPVANYPNARPALGVLMLMAISGYTVFAIVAGYFEADEDKGRTLATVWIFLGMIPFVAASVSSDAGGWRTQFGAAVFTLLAVTYRFQRRGWLR